MIIQEFSFGNFRSFKDIQTLNLSTAKRKSKNEDTDLDNVIKDSDKYGNQSFLKSKAIYGANASGKSNVIDAFFTFLKIIEYSVKDAEVLKLIHPFRLSTETENEPSFFQLVFWDKNIKYRYGFELNDEKIFAEWLYAKPGKRELCYFIRENQKITKVDKTNFKEAEEGKRVEIFRENSLFLTSLSNFGFAKISKDLVASLRSVLVIDGLRNKRAYKFAVESLSDPKTKKDILDFLKYGDVGIEELDTVEVPLYEGSDKKYKIVISLRKKFDKNFKFIQNQSIIFRNDESEGTKKLFELSPLIYSAIRQDIPIIIDEFDARFHPLLTKKIVKLFNSKQNLGSQLIFVTHDTNLLDPDLLRRDQIEFVEKDKYGASHLYSLVEFKDVRNTDSFEKDYIKGKYGAIPFLGNFDKLIHRDS